jgi:hypothetical protein
MTTPPEPPQAPAEVPGSLIQNGWLVTCHQCGSYDLVGPGHPAVRQVEGSWPGHYEFFDRTAVRHNHGPQCVNDPESGYSLDIALAGLPQRFSGAAPLSGIGGTVAGLLNIARLSVLCMRALAMYRLAAALGMMDQTLVDSIMSNLLHASTTATWTPGTGGTSITITPPILLRLMSTTGTETGTGTQCTAGNSPGYTAGGSSMGTNAFAAFASGSAANGNQVQWTASGTWTAGVAGIECYDSSGTPVRILWGALTTAIAANAVTNTDTITFAASSITANASNF